MKVSLKQLAAIAKACGFNGNADDGAAMLAYCKSVSGIEVANEDGTPIDLKGLELETKKVSIKADEPAKIDKADAPDFDIKIKAAVEAGLKAAGMDIAAGKRPNLSEPVAVKSAVERQYEYDIKTGKAAFDSFERSAAFLDALRVQYHAAMPGGFEAEACKKALARLSQYACTKNYGTAVDAGGGALVPQIFSADIQRNMEQYGVATRLGKVIQMQSDTQNVPVSKNLDTAYFPDQGTAATATTNQVFERQKLNAQKCVVVKAVNNELLRDANVNVGDHFALVAAETLSYKQDDCFFNGNGNATYGGMYGIIPKITAGTLGTIYSSVTGGGDWSAHTMAHLTKVMGSIKALGFGGCVWAASQQFIGQVMLRLAQAQGGVTVAETVGFGKVMKFLDFPVIPVQVMNRTASTGTNTIDCIFGDFSRAALFGQRGGVEIAFDSSQAFTSDVTYMRAMSRFDVNVWDVGSSSEFGPICALYQT